MNYNGKLILMTTKPDEILPPDTTFEFTYDGKKRKVTDVTLEPSTDTIVGFERTKSGKPTEQVKRYSVEKMKNTKIDK
jgi:hypothetical protein